MTDVSPRPTPTASEVEPSAYQRAIYDFVRNGRGHGVVQATAGSGKTTTLVRAAHELPVGTRALFVAFNRHTARELERRLPPGTPGRTVHALGLRALAAHLQRRDIAVTQEPAKYRRLVREATRVLRDRLALGPEDAELATEYLQDLVHFARLDITPTRDERAVAALAERHGLAPPGARDLVGHLHAALPKLLRRGVELALSTGTVDFTDMLYVPVVKRLPPQRYDFVCVDEAQDLSVVALELTLRLAGDDGRLLFVGDPRQSIYGFAGADTNAMRRITERTRALVLPLSVTYRCPKAHVALARILAPEIESAPGAAEGAVHVIAERHLPRWAYPGDLVVCRNNAPLVGACLALVRSGRNAYLLGRDVGEALTRIAQDAFPDGLEHHEARLAAYLEAERSSLDARGLPKGVADALHARHADMVGCLRYLVGDLHVDPGAAGAGPPDLPRLLERIERTFRAQPGAVTLSTVHRAKGKEANRVLLLHPHALPAPYARTPDALEGEACVQFVALTRAKRDLVFVVQETEGCPWAALLDPRAKPPRQNGRHHRRQDGPYASGWDEVRARLAENRSALPPLGRAGRTRRRTPAP